MTSQGEPRATVIIPTFNRIRTLSRAIDSVLGQTFGDFELIVVDDASTDDTPSFVGGLDDGRIIYVRNEVNRGGAASRDRGIDMARGEYIAFLDSDDEWLPHHLARIDAVFSSDVDREVGVAETGFQLPDGDTFLQEDDNVYERLLGFERHICISSVAVRREALGNELRFDNPTGYAQDRHLFMEVSTRFRFVSIPEVLVRLHDDGGNRMNIPKVQLAKRKHFYALHEEEIAARPQVLARHHGGLGSIYMATGEYHLARAKFWRAMMAAPTEPRWWFWWLATMFGRFGPLMVRQGKKLVKGVRALKSRA